MRKNRSACYRQNRILETSLNRYKQQVNMYRKRLTRLRKKITPTNGDTPRSKTRKLLRRQHVNLDVRRTLNYHHALVQSLKTKFRNCMKEKERSIVSHVVLSGITKRYRKIAEASLGFSRRRWKTAKRFAEAGLPCKQRVASKMAEALKSEVKKFYIRDDVSRSTTGEKETRTMLKEKKQKRFLTDTMQILHARFISEFHGTISYSLFCRLRPYWVVVPTAADRSTCQCKTHENLAFKANRMKQLKLIETEDLDMLAAKVACDVGNKTCMYGECTICKNAQLPIRYTDGVTAQDEIWWWEWNSKAEEREKKGDKDNQDKYTVHFTIKEKVVGSVDHLVNEFCKDLPKYKKHTYNIKHQYRKYREIRENLKEDEVLLHIDFAENYAGKYANEIQSVHFGSGHQQVTLHTGVYYTKGRDPVSFCTVSPCLEHNPVAIWSYLDPVFNHIKDEHELSTVHIFSDGPVTQYRQKQNFFLLSTKPFQSDFKLITWNFFESSHGKGAPDGVGGALKRSADRIVAHGVDVPNAITFYEKLNGSAIKLFYVSGVSTNTLPTLPTVTGTMALHQVVCSSEKEIAYRHVSCFCSPKEQFNCECFNTRHFSFITEEQQVAKTASLQPVVFSPDLTGQHCIVEYDGHPYPGIIVAVDQSDVLVKAMHRVGRLWQNRFFWPSMADECWYNYDAIITLIPEPHKVGSRHQEVDHKVWALVVKKYG